MKNVERELVRMQMREIMDILSDLRVPSGLDMFTLSSQEKMDRTLEYLRKGEFPKDMRQLLRELGVPEDQINIELGEQ